MKQKLGRAFLVKDINQAKSPGTQRLLKAAMDAAPDGYLEEDVVEHLPRHPINGLCRICGKEGPLTREHIPPRASGNKSRTQNYGLSDWLNAQDLDELGRGILRQGGIYGYTLCTDCNSFTGRHYGGEYRAWAARGHKLLAGLPKGPEQLDGQVQNAGLTAVLGGKEDGGVSVGAFVRQVLSCMCSLSGTWNLASRHPELRRIILEQSAEAMPPQLELGLDLYLGPRVRVSGPQLRVDTDAGAWRWMMELAFPPFAFVLVVASNQTDPGLGLPMNDWTEQSPTARSILEATFQIGFGWTPYPSDYRSRAAIEKEAAKT